MATRAALPRRYFVCTPFLKSQAMLFSAVAAAEVTKHTLKTQVPLDTIVVVVRAAVFPRSARVLWFLMQTRLNTSSVTSKPIFFSVACILHDEDLL